MKLSIPLWIPTFFLAIAMAGTTWWYSIFAKLHVGPIYILEILFLLWLISVLVSKNLKNVFQEVFKGKLLPYFLFFIFGLLHTLNDLFFSSYPHSRIIENSTLYVYPLLWVAAGYWLAKEYEKGAHWLAKIVLVLAAMSGVINYYSSNLSMGPIGACFLVYAALIFNHKNIRSWALLLFSAVVAYFPFWSMWWNGLTNRTSLGLLFLTLSTSFFFVSKKQRLKMFAVSLFLVLLFLLSLGAVTLVQSFTKKTESVSRLAYEQLYSNLQHGEDMTHDGNWGRIYNDGGSFFKFRDRKFWWSTAFEDWKKSPILGRGFAIEIPTLIRPGVKNDGIFENAPDFQVTILGKPVKGPHNSFLTVLARMGVIGLGLILWMLVSWVFQIKGIFKNTARNIDFLYLIALAVIPFNGFVHAFMHVGFETPYNCVILWLFTGLAYNKRDE